MDLDQVKQESERMGMWAHLATTAPDGAPHLVPVHPSWEGDTLWVMVGLDSVKARNIRREPRVMLHWQVGEDTGFDSLMVWGAAAVHDDLDTKRRLWTGVFDYDLDMFSPGGPDDSPETGFVSIEPVRAVVLRSFGAGGREEWRRS